MKKILSIILTVVMIFSLSIVVFAEVGDVDVTGHIGEEPIVDPDPDPDDDYDITFTSSVHWWVTASGTGNVVNGNSIGPKVSQINSIVNNAASGEDIKVSFVSFVGDAIASGIADDLTLNLTGDLANDTVSAINLSGDYTGKIIPYSAPLVKGTDWTFGFAGTYSGTFPPAATINPSYTMTLGFAF
jgi:hypothetical protein